jgi:3-phosphoshikimate 1-carboxyvinyltransferase
MVEVVIRKTEKLSGEVGAPPSKAYTQRMLIAAALSHGTSELSNPLFSDDTEATMRAVRALGAKVNAQKERWTVEGATPLRGADAPIDCGESGATLRFMIPVAALAMEPSDFVLGKSLEKRPIEPLLKSLTQLGATTSVQRLGDKSSIKVHGGGIAGGKTTMPGDVSSQFVSGLMFACPMARAPTEIVLSTPPESKGYVQMTKDVLDKHKVRVSIAESFDNISIAPDQSYIPWSHRVPGDFSSAAFLLAAAAVTRSKISIGNLDYWTVQGDKAIVAILEQMGLTMTVYGGRIEMAEKDGPLDPVDVDARDIPDLVPVCTVLACFAKGTSKIHDAHRLRYKESDRLLSLYLELRKMGAELVIDDDSLWVKGPCVLHGTTINPHGDHRIVMACAVAALGAGGETRIHDSECVKKSYPGFFNALRVLGVDVVGWEFDR